MITRPLSFLTDLIIFLFSYCFVFVSILILYFDRNIDYDKYIFIFYILLGIFGYLYFIVPLYFKGKTLGKYIFKIRVENNKGLKNILLINLKYICFRFFPIVSALLLFEAESFIIKIILGLISLYPIFDYYYLKANEVSFTDKLLHMSVKIY